MLAQTGCSLFRTPEPDLIRTATFQIAGAALEEPFGLTHRKGELYVSDGQAGTIIRISNEGEAVIYAEGLGTPSHIAFDASGDLLVADSGSHTIKRVKSGGGIEIVAGVEGKPGFADGGAGEALFRAPVGIAVSDGVIYVADTYNDRIRTIRDGRVGTLAGSVRGFSDGSAAEARFDTPTGIAVTGDGRVLVADTGNALLRAVDPGGVVSTIAGTREEGISDGPALGAMLSEPASIAVSEKGDIFFTDLHSVRRVRKEDGSVETLSERERGYSDSAQSEPRSFNRPTGLAIGRDGSLYVADSDNHSIRVFSRTAGKVLSQDETGAPSETASEFRSAAAGRWPFDPWDRPRDIAGTVGEIRGVMDSPEEGVYFHNGLDIAGGYGEKTRFVRREKVLRPLSAANFGTLRELLRMPRIGYVHVRLGRGADGIPFGDPRFLFDEERTAGGTALTDVRVPRGSVFEAGEVVGTLNEMNHVHLIAGSSGREFNALEALDLPGVSDRIAPVITSLALIDEAGKETEASSLTASSRVRVIVEAFDRMDGNPERRRLGLHRAGYRILQGGSAAVAEPVWNIVFDGSPDGSWVPFVYAPGSSSGAAGTTVFRYIVTNTVSAGSAREGFLPLDGLSPGRYTLRVFVGDFFGNVASKDIGFKIG